MSFVLGVDIGTEGTKLVVVDDKGRIIEKCQVTYVFDVPQSGWTEQDPVIWWNAFLHGLSMLWEKGISASDISCVGIAGQMHSAVILDKGGNAIRKSILWNDTRTKQICDEVLQKFGSEWYQAETCNSLLPGFTLGKLLWIKEHEPELFRKIDKVCMPKDYINYRLTGIYSTDVSDASGTGVFDVRHRQWHTDLMSMLGLPISWFPDVFESTKVVGHVTANAAMLTGLQAGMPIVAGAADNAASAIGLGIINAQKGLVSVGTSGVVLSCLEHPPTMEESMLQNPTLHIFCHALPDLWYGMGVTLSAGASLRWFKDTFSSVHSYEDLMSEAKNVQAGSDGLIYLPFLTGERTPLNSDAVRAGFMGIGLQHQKSHFIRAVIEGVTFSLRDCLDCIEQINISVNEFTVTGGIVKSDLWLQTLCDIFEKPLMAQQYSQGAAYGAGLLAGLTVGFWNDIEEVFQKSSHSRQFIPSIHTAKYREVRKLYQIYTNHLLDCVKNI